MDWRAHWRSRAVTSSGPRRPCRGLPPSNLQRPAGASPHSTSWRRMSSRQKSTGFLIVQDRRVIYEHNWPLPPEAANFAANFTHGTDARGALQEDVASAQKSFIAILAGVAIDKGLLDISKPVSAYIGTGWSKAAAEQETRITVRHLLEMNSGLTEQLASRGARGNAILLQHAGLRVHEAGAGKSLRPDARRSDPPLAHEARRHDRYALAASAPSHSPMSGTPPVSPPHPATWRSSANSCSTRGRLRTARA